MPHYLEGGRIVAIAAYSDMQSVGVVEIGTIYTCPHDGVAV